MCYSLVRLVTVLVAFIALLGCDRFGSSDPGTQSQSVEGSELTLADGVQVGVGTVVAIEPASAAAEASALRMVVRLGSLSYWVPDPAAERSRYSDACSAELYEGLTRFGPDGVELGLAAGFTVDSAGAEYESTLRPGLKFSNGEPVSADDFKWSWERALSPRFSEGRGSEVLKWIVGAEGILSGEGDELVGVTVVDDRTLRVTLASALPNFPDLLAEPAATVLHRPNVEMWGFDWSSWQAPDASPRPPWYFDELPVDTGPFALTEFDFWDLTATFVRNEHYWDEPSGPDRIELVSIDFHIDNLAPDVSLDERAVDVVCGIAESASPSRAEEVSGPVPVRFSVPLELELLVLDPSADEISDTDFRRSLAASVTRPMATSGRAWTDIGPFGSVGWREASGVLPPELAVGMQGGRPGEGLEQALAGYASVRADASQRSGPILLEYFDATRGPDDTLSQRIGSWSMELGVELTPVYTTDSDVWFPPAGRTVAVRRVRIAPPLGTAYGYFSEIDQVFGVDNDAPEVRRFRDLLERAVLEVDDVERDGLYREVERHLVESALVIPLYVSDDYARSLAQPWLRWLETPASLGSRFKDVWIDVDHPDYFPVD